jgi:uncharacterized protein YndB with AHSA1/START domain
LIEFCVTGLKSVIECGLVSENISPIKQRVNRVSESTKWSEVHCAQYELAIEIEASRERVWRGLTDQLGTWWLPDFHMLGTDSIVTLEAHAGGRLFEKNGNQQLLWYTVVAIHENESMDLVGYINAKYGGPATTMLNATLSSLSQNRTQLQISDALYGRVSEGLVASLNNGWQQLFHDGLKRFLESEF